MFCFFFVWSDTSPSDSCYLSLFGALQELGARGIICSVVVAVCRCGVCLCSSIQITAAETAGTTVATLVTIPPYGQRKGWVPRSQADFGDGGAYPEIMMAQYPILFIFHRNVLTF